MGSSPQWVWVGRSVLFSVLLACGSVGSSAIAAPREREAELRRAPGNVDISRASGNEAETAVAINQANPMQVTVVSNLDSGSGMSHGWSTDGGLTWKRNVIADGDNLGFACCDGQLTSDEFGNIFLVYLTSAINVQVAVSTDGGATFQLLDFAGAGPAVLPAMPWKSLAAVGQAISGDQPSIAAASGSVWISWTGGNGAIQAAGAPVTGLGQVGPFTATQTVPGGNGFGDYGDTAIGPDGQVLVVYQNPTGGQGPATIYTAVDPDGLGPQKFSQGQVIQTTNVGGFDFIPAQSGRSVDAEAGLAWDLTGGPHHGRVYFLYVSEAPPESNDMDIQVRYSDDGGVNWSDSVRVNDDATTRSQFNPRIALDATTGLVAVAWYDARNDRGDHGPGDTNGVANDDIAIYASLTRDGGDTFLPNRRLSAGVSNDDQANNGVDYGDYEGLAFYGGRLYFGWADNSNSTGDNPDGKLNTLDVYSAPVNVH